MLEVACRQPLVLLPREVVSDERPVATLQRPEKFRDHLETGGTRECWG